MPGAAPNATLPALVLVHGLFYGRWSMAVLARRLKRYGVRIHAFGYAPTRVGLARAADALAAFIAGLQAPVVHCVGHSFGGLVVLRALIQAPHLPAGRAVLLGSPLRGSRVARQLLRWPPGRALLRAAGPPLAAGMTTLPRDRDIGMIAGGTGLGLGRLTGVRLGPSDGTVAVDETRVPGLRDHRVLAVSHTGMLVSRCVAERIGHFLAHGRFGSA